MENVLVKCNKTDTTSIIFLGGALWQRSILLLQECVTGMAMNS